MKFSCDLSLLQESVDTASKAVASKSSIPALEGLLIQAEDRLTITGYDMKVGIRTQMDANVTQPGSLILKAKYFSDILRKLNGSEVTITSNERQGVSLRCGAAELKIPGLPADDFPEIPAVEDGQSITLQQKTLRTMIDQVAFAVSTNESRPIHTGVLFEVGDAELTMVAVDGFRLAIRREPMDRAEGGAFSFVAPGSALNLTKAVFQDEEDPVEILMGKKNILFHTADKELTCRRLEGEFLDYRAAIPRKNPIAVEVDTKQLGESISLVSAVIVNDKLKSPVRCVFEKDQVVLTVRTGDSDAMDVCPISGDGQGLEIGFNNRYLMEALRYAPADSVRVELNTGISPAIIVPTDGSENFLYMVLPVRLKSGE